MTKRTPQLETAILQGFAAGRTIASLCHDAIFVDAGAMGGAVVDRLRQIGVEALPRFSAARVAMSSNGPPGTLVRTADRRAELWTRMRAWLATGAIPDESRLADDLTSLDYRHTAADALACTSRGRSQRSGGEEPCTWHG